MICHAEKERAGLFEDFSATPSIRYACKVQLSMCFPFQLFNYHPLPPPLWS